MIGSLHLWQLDVELFDSSSESWGLLFELDIFMTRLITRLSAVSIWRFGSGSPGVISRYMLYHVSRSGGDLEARVEPCVVNSL